MKGEVFIVWGQNCRLAEAVAKELNRKDFHATVGGSDQYTDTHYLGQNVMNQMSSATRAIVLAQWPPDGEWYFAVILSFSLEHSKKKTTRRN